MAFAHSKNSRVFLNERHASGQITGYTVTHQRGYGPATTLLESGQRYIPGLMTGAMGLRGLFDSAQFVDTEVIAANGVDNSLLVTVCPDATTIGQPAMFCQSDLGNYEVAAAVADSVTFAVDTVPDALVDMGIVLHDHASESTSTNSTSYDQTAGTTNGAAAILHVTAYSGLTNAVIKVQHSTNNSTWVDLITFTTVTAATQQLATVTGTINRYVRVASTLTGVGSLTYAVGFATR